MFKLRINTLASRVWCWSLIGIMALMACRTTKTLSDPVGGGTEPKELSRINQVERPEKSDPTCCDPSSSEGLKKAWRVFTENGRYRLARSEEMKDSEAITRRPFAYAPGDLGYDFEAGYHHLVAIVVDRTRTDANRFSAVVFSAPRGEKGSYRSYWLLRDQDLSRAYFSGYSGYLELVIYNPNGTVGGCDIRWIDRLRKYPCKWTPRP